MKMYLKKDCVKVELQGDSLPVDVQYLEPFHFNRSKTIFYFSKHKLPEVLQVFGKSVDALPAPVRAAYDEVVDKRRRLQNLLLKGPELDVGITPSLALRPHQELDREIAMVYPKFAFYYDTRTGKTPTSIA